LADLQPIENVYPFAGGIQSDGNTTERRWEDLENLLPPAGSGTGLKPRNGIEYVHQLTTEVVEGCTVHLVTLDDVTRTKVVALMNASTGQIVKIDEYTEQYGRKALDPYAGGHPDDPTLDFVNPVLPDVDAAELEFGAAAVSGDAGTTFEVPLTGVGFPGDVAGASYVILNEAGEIATAEVVTPEGTCSATAGEDFILTGTLEVEVNSGVVGQVLTAYLYAPTDCTLSNPSHKDFTVNGEELDTYAPIMYENIATNDTTIDVVFWDVESYFAIGTTPVTVTLTGLSASGSLASAFRCGPDYFAVLTAHSGSVGKLHLYSLAAVRAGTLTPTRTVTINGTLTEPRRWGAFPHNNGKLYFVDYTNLHTVTLSTGALSTAAISGMDVYDTDDFIGEFRARRISSDGYLLMPVDESASNHYLLKINPTTAAIAHTSPVSVNKSLAHCAPLPNGEVYVATNNGHDQFKYVSNLSSRTSLGTLDFSATFPNAGGPAVTAAGDVSMYAYENGGSAYVQLFNPTTGALLGTDPYATSSQEFVYGHSTLSSTQLVRVQDDGFLQVFNATTGEIDEVVPVPAFDQVVPDAFAYECQYIVTAHP
jgi:hypothetical protein